ncbi:DUF1707 domain-containing protein [Streptomyces sp. NPDC057445]|uniref:DUF1707 SHOCT-like domain-containing protein n=1 Tax=Streptomyces sp. NPDC057445 TaxID=3346136 RepID=UPI003673CE68
MHPDPGPGPVLASDAEREATVERLRVAAVEGRLTLEELAERSEVAYLARTRSELAAVAEDLPLPVRPPAGSPPPSPGRGRTAVRALIGDVVHRGPVPGAEHVIEATAVLGDLILDLSAARAPASGVLTVTAWAVLGDVTLVVPEGVETEVTCSGMVGGVRDLTRPRPSAPDLAPRVRVTGVAVLGDIVVTHPAAVHRSVWRMWLDTHRTRPISG